MLQFIAVVSKHSLCRVFTGVFSPGSGEETACEELPCMAYPPDDGPRGELSEDQHRSPKTEGARDRKAGGSGGRLGRCRSSM